MMKNFGKAHPALAGVTALSLLSGSAALLAVGAVWAREQIKKGMQMAPAWKKPPGGHGINEKPGLWPWLL